MSKVREAAELIIEECEACSPLDYAIVKRVCRAYLADHPADDGEEITEQEINIGEYIIVCHGVSKNRMAVAIWQGQSFIDCPFVKTKGQLRRLIAALKGEA